MLAALVPVVTLAASGHDRYMFGGAYAVDHYAIALKGFFLVATYITILLSVDYINEGDYYKGEFYVLLLTSAFGLMHHGVGARPHHAVRRARDDLDPDVHPRRRSASTTASPTKRA